MKTDVLVIGSSAAGLVSALTCKRVCADKKVTVTTLYPKTLIPCGIPYIFGTVGNTNNDILPADKMFKLQGVEMKVDQAKSIHLKNKKVIFESGDEIFYDKLVISTGSVPNKPTWLKGVDFLNVFTVHKSKDYLDAMQEKLSGSKKIAVIGAGFIGVEISDELNKAGSFEGIDRHPGTLKDTHKQIVKLIVGKESGVILGGEVVGGLSAEELTNTLGIIVQNKMNLNALLTAQIGTHPLLTASPAGYPLIKAAENASSKMFFN